MHNPTTRNILFLWQICKHPSYLFLDVTMKLDLEHAWTKETTCSKTFNNSKTELVFQARMEPFLWTPWANRIDVRMKVVNCTFGRSTWFLQEINKIAIKRKDGRRIIPVNFHCSWLVNLSNNNSRYIPWLKFTIQLTSNMGT